MRRAVHRRRRRSRTASLIKLGILGAIAVLLDASLARFGPPEAIRGPAELQSPGEVSAASIVVETERPWLYRGCGSGCESAYLELSKRHADLGTPVSQAELNRRLAAAEASPPARSLGLDREELRAGLVRELNLRPLLDGLDYRRLAVAVLHEAQRPGYTQRKLLFWDPWVSSFEATLLVPDGPGPHPAVLGLHGHRHDDERFVREYLGEQLAARGYVVLAPRFRAHDCSLTENRIARKLLRRGFTLMGLHVYEALLMVKYLDSIATVDGSRIGLLGHSGGSSIANVLVRVSDRFSALVIDHEVDFRNRCGLLGLHCETVPGMFPLSADLNDRSTLMIPWVKLPYGYRSEEDRRAVFAFLDEHMSPIDYSTM